MRQFTAGLSKGAIIRIVMVCAAVAAGGIAAVSVLGTGTNGGARTAAAARVSASAVAGEAARGASAPTPQVVAAPRTAVMPKSAAKGAARAGVTASTGCAHPSFVTSAPAGMWNLPPYYVYNDMWNVSGYHVRQTLYACSYSNWYVVADMSNDNGDGAVKTYPNAQKDFSEPRISSLHSVTSTFAEKSPGTGVYEDAYDIWLNGIAGSGSTEVMIWTENQHQVPAGSRRGTVTFGGRSYTVWKNGSYIAFVAGANFASGTVNLLQFFQWIIARGWIPANSTLNQVCYGVELVSTNGVPATFAVTDFSVTAS